MSSATGKSEWYRRFLPVFIGGIVAVAALAAVTLATIPAAGRRFEYVLVSLFTVALFSITSLVCVFNWARGSWRPAAVLGLVLAPCSLALFLADIWAHISWGHARLVEEAMALGATWSILMPLLGLLGLARLNKRWLWTRAGTQLMAALTALFITWFVVADPHPDDDWFRVLGVLLVLTSCGAICVPVLHWINVLHAPGRIITTPLQLKLTCPRCDTTQELAAGASQCGKCGLKFRIEIEEEHCPKCGYALYKLTSAQCPECGTPVLGLVDRPGERRESVEKTHAG